ncbi:hypothetical protein CALVIDRAFT_596249 [Calocera viscosa TUFC12733]|uniref:Uncharacterized protein n=1 Tax=Calocera viscosa (strain TUFC12733) TaxID=1330018 RepID=A0A167PUJ1_CALVF|nr:hypothetical protein CALVIDRAFT_596249 [Calocera viscosa TUFC12733]
MDSGSEWDVRSLPSDFSLSLPSSPGHGPVDSHGMPGTPLSQHSVPDSAFSLSPHSASHVFLPPPMEDRDRNGALETSRTLVLPSLPWPHLASPYGETMGEMKLLVVSRLSDGEHRERVRRTLLEENSDVLHVYAPETLPDGRRTTLAGSTMRTGEIEEGAKNISVTEAIGYDEHGDVNDAIRSILSTVYEQFRLVQPLLNPTAGPTPQLIDLLASPGSHFYLTCIFLLPHDPTPLEHTLFRVLEATMPIVSLDVGSTSSYHVEASSSSHSRRHLHSTHTLPELVHLLFRSPQHRDKLRREAASGFLTWWSAERESALEDVVATGPDSVFIPGREPHRDTSSPLSFRTLPMPVLDPLHHSMLFSPLTLLPPLFQRMTRLALSTTVRDGLRCTNYPDPASSTPSIAQDEKKNSFQPFASVNPDSDRDRPCWTWGRIVRGVAGFAAMTAIWARLVWATTV